MAQRARDGHDGPQVEAVLADECRGAVDGLGVALGVDRVVRVGVRQAHRGPEPADDVDLDAGALGEVTGAEATGAAQQLGVQLTHRRLDEVEVLRSLVRHGSRVVHPAGRT